jgi:hypothetical protein
MPRQYLLQSVTPAPRWENPSVFRWLRICRDMYCPILGDNPDSRVMCTILSRYHEPLYSTRLPALKQTNFGLSPIPYQGNVVAQVNCSERTLSDHQCHLKNYQLLYPPFVQKPFLKTFQWGRHYPKVFERIFEIFFECSQS